MIALDILVLLCGQRLKSLGFSSRVLNRRAATLSKTRFPLATAKTYHRDAVRPRDDGNPDDPNDSDDESLMNLKYPSIPYIILIMIST